VASHRDGTAVLDGHTDDLRLASGVADELVRKRRHQDRGGRTTFASGCALCRIDLRGGVDIGPNSQEPIVRILHVVRREAGLAVEPKIAHHAMGRGVRAGRERRVSDDRLRVRMRMMRVSVNDTILPKVPKSSFAETVVIARRQVTSQLIHRDLQNESRPVGGNCGVCGSEQNKKEKSHE